MKSKKQKREKQNDMIFIYISQTFIDIATQINTSIMNGNDINNIKEKYK